MGRRTPAPAVSTGGGGSATSADARADGLEAPGRPEGGALGPVIGRRQCAAGPEERHGQAQHERPVRVGDLDFILHICLINPPVLLTSTPLPQSPGSRAIAKDAAPLAPTKALKTGARAMLHTAPQPLPVVDIVAEAAKLQKAMARGAQKAQQARAPESGGDAGQSGVVTAAQDDAEGEVSRGGANDATRPDVEIEADRGDADSAAQPVAGGEIGGSRRSAPPAKWQWRKPASWSVQGPGMRVLLYRRWRKRRR